MSAPVTPIDGAPDGSAQRLPRDAGTTFVELTIVTILITVLVASLSAAVTVALRTTPDTEERIDDARATRGLATLLSHDTTSTPPFLPEQAQGGMDIDPADNGNNNDCGGGGSNLLHLQWTESAGLDKTFVANYRFEVDAGVGTIVRYACKRAGTSPFAAVTAVNMTSGLDPANPPVVGVTTGPSGDVATVTFSLTGATGETVLVETASRNPADFFP